MKIIYKILFSNRQNFNQQPRQPIHHHEFYNKKIKINEILYYQFCIIFSHFNNYDINFRSLYIIILINTHDLRIINNF